MKKILTYRNSKYNNILHGVEANQLLCPICRSTLLCLDNTADLDSDVIILKSIRKLKINITDGELMIFCNIHKGYVQMPVLNYLLSEILGYKKD